MVLQWNIFCLTLVAHNSNTSLKLSYLELTMLCQADIFFPWVIAFSVIYSQLSQMRLLGKI